MKILLGDVNAKVGRKNILKQTGMRVYMKLVIIMGLEEYIFPPQKICREYTQCSHIATFKNTLELFLMGKHTTREITSW
jgi:hypothetical protein